MDMGGSMELARYVVDAVVLEGRSVREVARTHGVSKSWVAVLVARYRTGGYEALEPRSRRAHARPNRTPERVEDEVIRVRKHLVDEGFDAGARTIHWHLSKRGGDVPSISTIWRILSRRGFIDPEPNKRPHNSFIRFEAALPNECWQADVTHWRLKSGAPVEILDFIDDHSRVIVGARVVRITRVGDVVSTFHDSAAAWGYPASVLTDNGAIFNGGPRRGVTAFESLLTERGIVYRHSRPYHPQTCGKIERWHQTLKRFLAHQAPARSIGELQRQVDRFVSYYNEERPHRARGSITPLAAFEALDKARPGSPVATTHFRVRTDKVDSCGKVTLRHDSKLFHIAVGRRHQGTPIRLYVADLDIRIVTLDGTLLRHLTLDTSRTYQPSGLPRTRVREGSRVPR
jgi:transposase InsO family protein